MERLFWDAAGTEQLVRREWESERASGGVGRRVESNAHCRYPHTTNKSIDRLTQA